MYSGDCLTVGALSLGNTWRWNILMRSEARVDGEMCTVKHTCSTLTGDFLQLLKRKLRASKFERCRIRKSIFWTETVKQLQLQWEWVWFKLHRRQAFLEALLARKSGSRANVLAMRDIWRKHWIHYNNAEWHMLHEVRCHLILKYASEQGIRGPSHVVIKCFS